MARRFVRFRKRRGSIRNARWHIGGSRSPAGRTSISRWCRRRRPSWLGRNSQLAQQNAAKASPVERELIERSVNVTPIRNRKIARRSIRAYADAMREVWKKYPKDPGRRRILRRSDDGFASVESMDAGRPAESRHGGNSRDAGCGPETESEPSVRESSLHSRGRSFAASGAGERRRPIVCATLQPGVAHNVHMPSHIDIRCGRWQQAVDTNVKAVAADQPLSENRWAAGRIHQCLRRAQPSHAGVRRDDDRPARSSR